MKNYGLVINEIADDQYILGAIGGRLFLQPDGQWDKYLPEYEAQADIYETAGCTVWGWENLIEMIDRRVFGKKSNYSERFIYSIAKIRPPGADPHAVAECIRNNGLIDNDILPLSATYEEFISPVPCSTIPIGQKWLSEYQFYHEWLWKTPLDKQHRTDVIKDCLKYSPLGVTVTAWHLENGVYVDKGLRNTHWCVLYGWNDQGWKIFDSYDHGLKTLSYDHNIQVAKAGYLAKKVVTGNWLTNLASSLFGGWFKRSIGTVECNPNEAVKSFLTDLWEGISHPDVKQLQQLLNRNVATQVAFTGAGSPGNETVYFGPKTKWALSKFQRLNGITPAEGYFGPITRALINNIKPMTKSEELAKLAKEKIGTDFTDDKIVPDDVSCVFATTTILNELDPDIPIMYHTKVFQDWLAGSLKFQEIYEPEAGSIVICATGTNTRPDIISNGHTGIYLDDFNIVSNSSESGLWQQNYDRLSWRQRFYYRGGFVIRLFKKIS